MSMNASIAIMIDRTSKMSTVFLSMVAAMTLSVVSAQIVTTRIIGEKPKTPNETEPWGGDRVEVVSSSGWDWVYRGELTVDSKEGVTILSIPIRKGAGRIPALYNITFVIPNPPEGCNPNTTLRFSPAVYYRELCMKRDWMGKCTLPGPDGFRTQQELFNNYKNFKQVPFIYDIPKVKPSVYTSPYRTQSRPTRKPIIKKTIRGDGSRISHIMMSALQGVSATTIVSIGWHFLPVAQNPLHYMLRFGMYAYTDRGLCNQASVKDINFVEKWTCRGFDYFMIAQHDSDAFFTSRMFWAIIVPIGYFIGLVGVIFGTCYLCPCGAALKASTLLNVNLPFDIFDSDDESEDEGHSKSSKPRRKKK